MNTIATLDRRAGTAKRVDLLRCAALCLTLASLWSLAAPALAVDGCKVLLCFAASDWRKVPDCVPPVNQVLHDLARGKPYPACTLGGPANSASHQWSSAPTDCPAQYTRVTEGATGPVYSCDYAGSVGVNVDGVPWTRTWWNFGGATVTEYSPTAKARLGTWDTTFDDDYSSWLATQAPPATACSTC